MTEVQGAQALDRALNLIKLVAASHRVGIRQADITRLSGLTAPTAHRLMRALEKHCFVERDASTGKFHLGTEMYVLGLVASQRFNLQRAASESVARLTQETRDTILLTGRTFWHGICLARGEGTYPIRSHVVRVGHRAPLGITAGGSAILAALTDKDIEEALKTNAKEIAEHFPQFSLKLIRDTVAKTRARGFALNPGLLVPGSWGFALPITGPDGTCTGAITVAGVQQRFENQRLKQLTALVANEIKIIEQNLKNPALITRSKRPPKHVEQLDEEP